MTGNDSAERLAKNSTRFIAGAALICGAGVIGLVGIGLTSAAVVASVRMRMDRMPVPPRDLARQTWRQARAATTAGRDAWRDVSAVDGSRVTTG